MCTSKLSFIHCIIETAMCSNVDDHNCKLSKMVHFDACIINLNIYSHLNQEIENVFIRNKTYGTVHVYFCVLYISNGDAISLLSFFGIILKSPK